MPLEQMPKGMFEKLGKVRDDLVDLLEREHEADIQSLSITETKSEVRLSINVALSKTGSQQSLPLSESEQPHVGAKD